MGQRLQGRPARGVKFGYPGHRGVLPINSQVRLAALQQPPKPRGLLGCRVQFAEPEYSEIMPSSRPITLHYRLPVCNQVTFWDRALPMKQKQGNTVQCRVISYWLLNPAWYCNRVSEFHRDMLKRWMSTS
jgi:hypothetical protein